MHHLSMVDNMRSASVEDPGESDRPPAAGTLGSNLDEMSVRFEQRSLT